MPELQCIVVTPEETALDQSASFVVVPLFDGEFGVGPGHSPMIGRLGFGELRIRAADGTTARYYVDGGFVQVADNVVTLLTGRIVKSDKVDSAAAEQQLQQAMSQPVNTDELLQVRDRAIEQARAQMRIAGRSGS
ncbi:MAG: ATP synthase F1 subunit epsilon [Planctomycetales bacterium]|nr:ATP synthase F1 subunit epsilon [Planctomycetales bacterium]MCA9171826.1 ATP synthase F1 subunit epsilon [Planctomycetales bacterium]